MEILRTFGATLAPFNAWMLIQGMETLPLRMDRHCANALAVAKALQDDPRVAWVNYPGLPGDRYHALAQRYLPRGASGLLNFGIRPGASGNARAAGERFIEAASFMSHLANIGDAKTLIIHPASTTHRQMSDAEQLQAGVTPDMIRMSVGLETLDDILWDIDQALDLEALAPLLPPALAARVREWPEHPRVRALREDGRQRLVKLIKRTHQWTQEGSISETAALRWCDWIEPLLRRESYLALLLERPQVHQQLLRLLGAARWTARYLLQHPGVIDELASPALLIERFDSGWADGFSVLGIVSAVAALLLWATPSYCNYYFPLDISCDRFFEAERLPAVAAFLALAFILLLLRRR